MNNHRTFDFTGDAVWADPETGEMIYPAQVRVTPVITINLPR